MCKVCECILLFDQNYRYLELLSVLCVCDGVSIADNQVYITEKWLGGKGKVGNLLYQIELSYFLYITNFIVFSVLYTKYMVLENKLTRRLQSLVFFVFLFYFAACCISVNIY